MALFGATVGAGMAYGWSVAANISNNGMSVDAFTSDVDWGSVGTAAVVGGVAGLTGGMGAAYLGTGLGATAVSGVLAGQAAVATSNVMEGKTWNEGMGNPNQMAADAVLAVGFSAISEAFAGDNTTSKSGIPGKGYSKEVPSPNPVRPKDAVDNWKTFLGEEPYTNTHPRTGLPDPDRLVSQDGTRSIRFGDHEMNGPKYHYHQETWTYDPVNHVMNVDYTTHNIQKH